jgi:transposase-like protein
VAIKYYRCPGCNLTFKNLESAIAHKSSTIHDDIKEEYFVSRYEPFPPFEIEKLVDSIPELLPFENLPLGESTEPYERNEFYVCLSCRLTFKDRAGATEHKLSTRHKVVRENYPIGPSYPTNFGRISEIVGSNTDYQAFYQRTIDEVPNED